MDKQKEGRCQVRALLPTLHVRPSLSCMPILGNSFCSSLGRRQLCQQLCPKVKGSAGCFHCLGHLCASSSKKSIRGVCVTRSLPPANSHFSLEVNQRRPLPCVLRSPRIFIIEGKALEALTPPSRIHDSLRVLPPRICFNCILHLTIRCICKDPGQGVVLTWKTEQEQRGQESLTPHSKPYFVSLVLYST